MLEREANSCNTHKRNHYYRVGQAYGQATEPLPAAHPFWAHPRVTVLPHVAAQTDLRSAAAVVAANIAALDGGAAIAHRVWRERGY